MSIYDYSVPSVGGGELNLADYKGKVMLIGQHGDRLRLYAAL